MPVVRGCIIFGAFVLSAAIVEGDLQPETKRLTGKRGKSRNHT